MAVYDRPYFDNPRDPRRGDRDRRDREDDREFGRRAAGREDDDDRGPWISRDRDDDERGRSFNPDFDSRADYGRDDRGRSEFGSFGRERSYAGRGPKGYQRSDERLKEEVCERLTAAPDVDAVEIEVSVQNGEVMLDGTVRERSMKRSAEDCIEDVSGVRQVHNRLRVESPDDREERRSGGAFSTQNREGQRSTTGRKAH
jgi:hypothetical protein